MYDKYLEIFVLSDTFGNLVKHLREDMHFDSKGVAVYLMRRWFYAFPELKYYDLVNILNAYDREHNPELPETPVSPFSDECIDLDRILRKNLEKSIAHWQDDTDPIWHNLYNSQNVEKGV